MNSGVSKIYNKPNDQNLASGFKKTYCHECKPYFIGVWDTVGPMDWFWGRKFFDPTLHEGVTYGYHVILIDQKRKKFPVRLWGEKRKFDDQTIEQVWFPGVHFDVGGPILSADGYLLGLVSKDLTMQTDEGWFSPHYAGVNAATILRAAREIGQRIELPFEGVE